jgi:hypothetical protein
MALRVGVSFFRGTALTVADIPVATLLIGCNKKDDTVMHDRVVMSYFS